MSSNMNNINYEDFKNICRLCMLNCDTKFYLDCVVIKTFQKLTDIAFETNENLPQQICVKCFEKINDIHEFASLCKQTHTTLKECLNNLENIRSNKQQDENIEKKYVLPIVLYENVKIDKHEVEDVDDNISNLTDDNVNGNNQMEIKHEIIKIETSEINNDENTNCFEDDLLILNNSNYIIETEEISNNDVNLAGLIDDTNLSNCSNTTDINLEEINKNEEKIYKCDQCSKSLNFLSNRKYPRRQHDSERPYKCNHCSKPNQSGSHKEHSRLHNSECSSKCKICSKSFKYPSQLRTHLRLISDDRSFKCKQCSKSFSYSSNLNINSGSNKDPDYNNTSSDAKYNILNKRNHSLNNQNSDGKLKFFLAHMNKHSGERPFKCDHCAKSFLGAYVLKRHMRTHTGERPYKCKHCSKSFNQSGNLKIHMHTHTGERSYKCEQCSKSFIRADILEAHMRTHTGERPYKCEQCSKSFTTSWALNKHMRTHTGECPFKCEQCSKSFNRSDVLKTHMLTHTGERPYKCEQCSKSYTTSCSLKKHTRTHTGERPFKCKRCSKLFTQSSSLNVHMLTHDEND